MSEINNIPKMSGKVEKLQASFKGQVDKSIEPAEIMEEEKYTASNCELPKASGILGRSQVGKPDTVSSDVDAFLRNPAAVAQAVDFSDAAYADLVSKGAQHPYEDSVLLMDAYKEEFLPEKV